jgi:hypothetical protein
MAVDGAGNAATFTGTTWSQAVPIDGSAIIESLDCVSTSFCQAVDMTGNVLTYGPEGWTESARLAVPLRAVSCADTTFCLAVGPGVSDAYTGAWAAPQSFSSAAGRGLNAVSCAAGTFCMAGSLDGHVMTYNGRAWTSSTLVDGGWPIDSISCPTSTFCMAVDLDGRAMTYNGHTPGAPPRRSTASRSFPSPARRRPSAWQLTPRAER